MQAPKYLQDKLWRRIKQSDAEQGTGVQQAAGGFVLGRAHGSAHHQVTFSRASLEG